jgi:predicted nucleotidyltransferase
MRLSKKQSDAIISALMPFIEHEQAELRLYGSRVNDTLKGGDIDLLLLMDDPSLINRLSEKKHYLLAAIKKRLGDEKIDLLIANKQELNDDHFLKLIIPASIILKIW